MRHSFKKFWLNVLLILIIVIPVAIGIVTNVVTGKPIPSWLKPWLTWETLLILVLFLVIGRLLYDWLTNTEGTDQKRALRDRRTMLDLVKSIWVNGMLKKSLYNSAPIELSMVERKGTVTPPFDTGQNNTQANLSLSLNTEIVDVFNRMGRALLILGESGSGKTTVLLKLAKHFVDRAEKYPTQPIPIVLNLSSWTGKKQTIFAWLVEELNTRYNIHKKVAQSWVNNDELLLLFDGLDEVASERRNECVRAINDFRKDHLVPLVVCCRVADYETLTNQLKLQGVVLLQPLTSQQVDKYLDGAGVEFLAVRRTLDYDTTLREFARSPFMLNIMALAYKGMSVEELQQLDTIAARRKHLFDAYVKAMLEQHSTNRSYSQKQIIYWLAWLARNMSEQTQTEFAIEHMQSTWLQTLFQRRLFTIIIGLLYGIVGGLIGIWISGLIGIWIVRPIGSLIGGLIGGLTGTVISWPDIKAGVELSKSS